MVKYNVADDADAVTSQYLSQFLTADRYAAANSPADQTIEMLGATLRVATFAIFGRS